MQHATWLRPQTVPRETCTHLILRCPSLDVLGGASRAMGAAVAPCAGRSRGACMGYITPGVHEKRLL